MKHSTETVSPEQVKIWITLNPHVNYAIEEIEDEIHSATGVHTGEYTRTVLENVLHRLLSYQPALPQ